MLELELELELSPGAPTNPKQNKTIAFCCHQNNTKQSTAFVHAAIPPMSWPAARAEEDLEVESAGMGMGDVVQQSGNKGGEAGHGRARVSAATAAEGSDVGERPTCCVCMEPWTDSGAHRIW